MEIVDPLAARPNVGSMFAANLLPATLVEHVIAGAGDQECARVVDPVALLERQEFFEGHLGRVGGVRGAGPERTVDIADDRVAIAAIEDVKLPAVASIGDGAMRFCFQTSALSIASCRS